MLVPRRRLVRSLVAMLALGALLSLSASVTAQVPRVRIGGDIKPPTRIKYVMPKYPEDAKANRIQGVVFLEVVLATDGTVLSADVVRSVPELDEAALAAVREWEYTPTLLNGEPVELIMTVTISFSLN
jgi:protein TonB